jgi:hypothetical protein
VPGYLYSTVVLQVLLVSTGINSNTRAEEVAQVVEYLPNNSEALSSNSTTTKNKSNTKVSYIFTNKLNFSV